jgi:hypothetical protein
MSGKVDTGTRSFLPGSNDIPKFARVTATATGCDLAGVGDPTLGSAERPGYDPDTTRGNFQEKIPVKLWNADGTHYAIAAGAITAGNEFQAAASGKIAALTTGKAIGRALEAATANNDEIEVVYYPPSSGSAAYDLISDPGDAGSLGASYDSFYCELTSAGAETRTLADPLVGGITAVITMRTDGGNIVMTAATAVNATGNNTLTFADAEDSIVLVSVADGASDYKWAALTIDGGVALSTV